MREIVLDTETTGLEPESGHRIVEIGCVEIENLLPTGRTFHVYLNPERDMPAEAEAVHGLSADFLADKPRFREIVDDFLDFIGEAPLVIHNAAFDMRFLNAELVRAGREPLPPSRAVDTLALARTRFPGANNTLDALCTRFGIDLAAREKHGALLDSELLAAVYLHLKGGLQPGLELAANAALPGRGEGIDPEWTPPPRPRPLPPRLTEQERRAHEDMVRSLGDKALWRRFG